MIIDTHIHLNDEAYQFCIDQVIEDSVLNDCTIFCVMGIDYKSSLEAIELAKKYNGSIIQDKKIECYAFVGIYPGEVMKDEKSKTIDDLSWVEELYLQNKDVVKGIGEIGIDLYWDKTYKDQQIEFFKKQLDIASKLQLPVSIHAREATQVTFDILKEYKGKVKGVMHCYNGSIETARELIKIGYKLGIGGTLTYKNCKLEDVINELGLENFVTETDGPYLTPVPHRGKINKSAYIFYVIQKISEIKNLSFEETKNILANNAKEIFNL